ncbi:MAG: hypothetical protein K8S23_00055 [Candidatus Cloacimonetes bacterium]|nr:hypothetical protein [Candidatus Cloacimonadota bacterium]
MKKRINILVLILIIALTFVTLFSEDDEDKGTIKFKELPKKVQKAFLKISDIKLITEIESEKETENITVYEIETKKGKIETSHIFTQDGALIEIKKSIDYNELPKITKKLLKEKFPKLKIEELEEVQEFSYEIEGKLDGKTVAIEISNDGDIEIEKENDENENDKYDNDEDDDVDD